LNKDELLSYFKNEIVAINEAMRQDIEVIKDPLLKEIVEYALFGGGKRIRPLLTVFCARLCGRDEPAHAFALAFEYVHVATLLHDDVIDHAEKRRGRPAAHTIWGVVPVILAGDYLHARSLYIAVTMNRPLGVKRLSEAISAMVEAEFLQLRHAGDFTLNEEGYFRILHGKTGFLIAAACEVGAILADAPAGEVSALSTYGMNLGLAFQVTDDLLDYLGDPEQTGKAAGNDFVEGKLTLPLIHALAKASESEQKLVFALLSGGPKARQDHLEQIHSLINAHDGFGYARSRAGRFVAEALGQLDRFPPSLTKELLIGLAEYVLVRKK